MALFQRLIEVTVASLTCSDAERDELRDIASSAFDSVNDPDLQNKLAFRMLLIRPALLNEWLGKQQHMLDAINRARAAPDQAAVVVVELEQLMQTLSIT